MRKRVIGAAFVLLAGLAGCGPEVPTPGVSAEVTGTLTAGGKPLGDVYVAFRAMGGTAQPARYKTAADGTFKGTLMSGKYSWYVPDAESENEGSVPKAELKKHLDGSKAVGAAYRKPSQERQIDVSSGAKLDLKAD